MSNHLDKSLEQLGYILDASQFDEYQKIYTQDISQNISLEQAILECGFKGFEQINLAKKDYLKSKLYKPGNILLIPYNHKQFFDQVPYGCNYGWYLSPWQILQINDNNVMLNCKHSLFRCDFSYESQIIHDNYCCNWKNSVIRNILNSDAFLGCFPQYIQTCIDFHDIWTNKEITKDRFWLLSWQDLGKFVNTEENKHNYHADYQNLTFYNAKVFNTFDDLIKYEAFSKDQIHYYLRSATVKYKICAACVGANGHLTPYWDYDSNLGCSPVFILNNDVHYFKEVV